MRLQLLPEVDPDGISTEKLLEITGHFSVHQYGALNTLVLGSRILREQKPEYLYGKLKLKEKSSSRLGNKQLETKKNKLNITDEGFLQRFRRLWNMLPDKLKTEQDIKRLKFGIREWVLQNINVQP